MQLVNITGTWPLCDTWTDLGDELAASLVKLEDRAQFYLRILR